MYKKIVPLILRLVYPPYCVSCKDLINESNGFCSRCIALIKPITSTTLLITPRVDMKVFAAGTYEEPLRSMILKKRTFHLHITDYLAQLIIEKTPIKNMDVDFLIPIPLHWSRYAYRGYNQAAEIAQQLAKRSIGTYADILTRTFYSPFQSSLNRSKRWENVAGNFKLHKKVLAPTSTNAYFNKNLLLVDDLCTTGSTLKAAARVLMALKPASITAVVVARTLN
jgi:ComF family protein